MFKKISLSVLAAATAMVAVPAAADPPLGRPGRKLACDGPATGGHGSGR